MKKWFCVILSILTTISLFSGCAASQSKPVDEIIHDTNPSIFCDITGIPYGKAVMKVGETEVPSELYFYWVCYVCSSLEYNILSEYSNYGMYSSCVDSETMSVQWDSEYAGLPLMEYALAEAESTIKYYMSIEELAAEMGVYLSDKDLEDMDSTFHQAVEEMGGSTQFLLYLEMLGINKSAFDRISSVSYLYGNLLELVFQNGSPLYLPDEDYDKFATYADHILIATQNMQTGENLSPEELLKKYNLAEDILEQLQASDDPETLFAELADEYSEDPGRESNPTGYIYTSGTMVGEFESAASLLEPGQISDLVQSDYGFHIILRRDLLKALEEDESKKVGIAKEYLNKFLVEKRMASEVVYDECLKDIDWIDFYARYIENADKIGAEMQAAS